MVPPSSQCLPCKSAACVLQTQAGTVMMASSPVLPGSWLPPLPQGHYSTLLSISPAHLLPTCAQRGAVNCCMESQGTGQSPYHGTHVLCLASSPCLSRPRFAVLCARHKPQGLHTCSSQAVTLFSQLFLWLFPNFLQSHLLC